MVTDAILGFFAAGIHWVFSLVPSDIAPPAELTGAVNALTGWVSTAQSMGVWFPLDLAVGMAAFVMHASIGGFVVKCIRILISHFTGGGGSAA